MLIICTWGRGIKQSKKMNPVEIIKRNSNVKKNYKKYKVIYIKFRKLSFFKNIVNKILLLILFKENMTININKT